MEHESRGFAPNSRVGLGGPPGIDMDVVTACVRACGYDTFSIRASALRPGDCDVLLLLEPRARDWVVARECGVGVVVAHREHLSDGACAELVLKGADAFVSLDASVEELDEAVATVGAGGSMLRSRVARSVAMISRHGSAPTGRFSLRERQVIEAAQARLSVKETARLLGVSVRTVHETQRTLFAKLGARNRAHALTLIHAAGGAQALLDQESMPDSFYGEQLRSLG
jgi:DNA-binding CsgD family transcriptional regulator